MSDGMQVFEVSSGCRFVHDGKRGVLFGCVSEVIKYLANNGLGKVRIEGVVLSDTTMAHGITNWAFEFPIYRDLFVDGGLSSGRRLAIIGTPEQLVRAREIIRITLLGPSKAEYRRWGQIYGMKHHLYDWLLQARDAFAPRGADGHILKLDELVEFVPFDATGICDHRGFRIAKQSKDGFSVQVGGETTELQLCFQKRPVPPFPIHRSKEVHRPYGLALRVLTYSNGFDPSSGCAAMVIWMNGVPVLLDAAPFVGDSLAGYGLSVEQMGGIIITHVHEDHSSLLEIMAAGRKMRVITTPEIFESLLIKLAALLDYDLKDQEQSTRLRGCFEFTRVDGGKVTSLYGAKLLPHYTIHSIPTIGMRIAVQTEERSYEILLSGDTVGPAKLAELRERKALPEGWCTEAAGLITGREDLVIHDGGADPAGLHPNPTDPALRKIAAEMGDRLIFGHRNSPIAAIPEMRLTKPGDLYEVHGGNPCYGDLLVFHETLEALGVTDLRDQMSLWYQGKIRPVTHDEVICGQSDKPDYFYIVLAGRLSVEVDGDQIAELNPGMFFGEIAILRDTLRTATVKTLSACRLLAVPRQVFTEFATTHNLFQQCERLWHLRSALAKVNLFRSLPARTVLELSQIAESVSIDAGKLIVEQGAPTSDFYVIVDGEVEVVKDGQVIAQRGPNSVIGEWAALHPNDPHRSASIRSTTACHLLRFTAETLRQLDRKFFLVWWELRLMLKERQLPAC